ncbi:MAG: hypothetical protein KDE33_12855 [Bacteroidetes bacterium]|nr:hypothetical protein [Bacteroidota bacterium]
MKLVKHIDEIRYIVSFRRIILYIIQYQLFTLYYIIMLDNIVLLDFTNISPK